MGALASMVGDIVNTATGSYSGTSLDDFLAKFSDAGGKYVNTIDPLGTFDVTVEFQPSIQAEDLKWGDKMLGALGKSLTQAVSGAADSLTGGLFTSLMNMGDSKTVMGRHDAFADAGKHTFIEYLAEANLLVGGENWFSSSSSSCPLTLQLGLYVQDVTVPNLKMGGQGSVSTPLGDVPVNGGTVLTDGALTMDILNTKAALHERIFYPWMREVTCPWWAYTKQPYTTATITVDFRKHNDVKYVFYGCRPTQINLLQGKQDADGSNITRAVTFVYDFMFIDSDLKTVDSAVSKLLGTVGSLASGAGNMVNL